ncbi:MAG: hypothetical protein ACI9WU_001465 [Myxococcota bacterium]|jgi:hypothetical protein
MLYPLKAQTAMDGDASFECDRMKQTLPYARCMAWFVDHNALMVKTSPCFKCLQGAKNRESYAKS